MSNDAPGQPYGTDPQYEYGQPHGRQSYPQQHAQPYGYGQPAPYAQPVAFVPAKTPGLSVLFSFLWLGAGNLYAGQTALGVSLILAQLVCAPIALIFVTGTYGFGALLTIPIWLAAFAVSAVTGYSACRDHNRRLGLPG